MRRRTMLLLLLRLLACSLLTGCASSTPTNALLPQPAVTARGASTRSLSPLPTPNASPASPIPTTFVSPLPAPARPLASPLPQPSVPAAPSPRAGIADTPRPTASVSLPATFRPADLAFADAQHGWALGFTPGPSGAGTLALRLTIDGGRTWQPLPAPPAAALASADGRQHLRFADAEHGFVFSSSALFATGDGGRRWEGLSVDGKVADVEVAGANAWVVLGHCAVNPPNDCYSTLAVWSIKEARWSSAPALPSVYAAMLLRASEDEAWLLAYPQIQPDNSLKSRLLHTSDAGNTWEEEPMVGGGCRQWAIDSDHKIWLLCGGGPATDMEIKQLYLSSDAGAHWELRAEASPFDGHLHNMPVIGIVNDLAVVSPQSAFISLGRSTVIGTDDGGRTWRYSVPDSGLANAMGGIPIVVFADPAHGWAIAWQGLVFHTDNGGQNWTETIIP